MADEKTNGFWVTWDRHGVTISDDPPAVKVGEQEQVERLIQQLRNRVAFGASGPFELLTRAADLIESLWAENQRWQRVFADVDIDRQAIAAERDQLREALQRAIKLLIKWHDGANDKVAVRFDLTDHPQVKPLYAALAQELGHNR